jgi:hypothetical protein
LARTLRASLAGGGFKITISQSLELITETFGMADWNTLNSHDPGGAGWSAQ